MPDIMTMKEWTVRTARLMVGIPDYQTYVVHRRQMHPDQPIMTYEEFFGSARTVGPQSTRDAYARLLLSTKFPRPAAEAGKQGGMA